MEGWRDDSRWNSENNKNFLKANNMSWWVFKYGIKTFHVTKYLNHTSRWQSLQRLYVWVGTWNSAYKPASKRFFHRPHVIRWRLQMLTFALFSYVLSMFQTSKIQVWIKSWYWTFVDRDEFSCETLRQPWTWKLTIGEACILLDLLLLWWIFTHNYWKHNETVLLRFVPVSASMHTSNG